MFGVVASEVVTKFNHVTSQYKFNQSETDVFEMTSDFSRLKFGCALSLNAQHHHE